MYYKILFILLVLPITLFSLNCQDSLNISHNIEKDGSVTFSFPANSCCFISLPIKRTPIIITITVYDLTSKTIVWSLDTGFVNLFGVKVKSIKYGIPPDWFTEHHRAKPLIKGHKYFIKINIPGGQGDHLFQYIY